MRIFLGAAAALLLFASGVSAGEIKGKITKIDVDKGIITLKVDDREVEFVVPADAKCACPFDKDLPDGLKTELRVQANGKVSVVKLFVEGATVKITTTNKNGSDVVTRVQRCLQ
jgi:hypothetical protein